MEVENGYALIARGALVELDYEQQARRAVTEEEGEIARMQAEIPAHDDQFQLAEAASADDQGRQTPVMSVQDEMTNVELLAQDRAELLAKVVQQAELIGQLGAELESLRRASAISRGVMSDILGSRGYCTMRLLGRWRAIERGIQRALREI